MRAFKTYFTEVKTNFFGLHMHAIQIVFSAILLVGRRKNFKEKKQTLKKVCYHRNMKGHRLWVSHKQEWGQGLTLLLLHTAVIPRLDAGKESVDPASGFVI